LDIPVLPSALSFFAGYPCFEGAEAVVVTSFARLDCAKSYRFSHKIALATSTVKQLVFPVRTIWKKNADYFFRRAGRGAFFCAGFAFALEFFAARRASESWKTDMA
jgi:hypothetical protein